jgi:hypothetical protein
MGAIEEAPSATVIVAPPRSHSPRVGRAKLLAMGLLALALLGVLGASLLRELTATGRTPGAGVRQGSLAPPRPAFTPAEEAYAHALWAVHDDVKSAAYTLTFSGLRYKLKQASAPEFASRVTAAAQSLGRSETRVRALAPPASLDRVHAQYLDAVHLFQQSAAEMLKLTEDGRDDHLLAAHPLSQEASEQLLRVGNTIWPGEYLPN